MDPNEIKLDNINKSFQYQKICIELDSCDSLSTMRDIAKSYLKLYLKQQEVLSSIGNM